MVEARPYAERHVRRISVARWNEIPNQGSPNQRVELRGRTHKSILLAGQEMAALPGGVGFVYPFEVFTVASSASCEVIHDASCALDLAPFSNERASLALWFTIFWSTARCPFHRSQPMHKSQRKGGFCGPGEGVRQTALWRPSAV